MSWATDLLNNKSAVVVYFAVLIVFVFLILWSLNKTKKMTERIIGSGVDNAVFTSGASQRHATEFTSTNQGDYTIVHNDELQQLVPGVIPQKGGGCNGNSERLVSERGDPDFWEISAELNAYKEAQVSPMMSAATTDPSGTGTSIDPTTGAVSSGSTTERFNGGQYTNAQLGNLELDLLTNGPGGVWR